MENNLEIEKKYLLKENTTKEFATNFLISKLSLTKSPTPILINHDIYYDKCNLLKNLGLNARQRKVGKETEYTLKIKLDTQSIDKRKELNFTSLEEMLKFIQDNLKLPIHHLSENLKLITTRKLYHYNSKDTLIEICFDEVNPYYENIPLEPFFMIESELKKGNIKELEYLNNTLIQLPFLKTCNLSKKDIALTKINSAQNLILKRTKD